jgi:putative ABC transport system ATP-binding protein
MHLAPDALAAVRNRRIGFVFQQFNLLARTSALENVELPLSLCRGEGSPSATRAPCAALAARGPGRARRAHPCRAVGRAAAARGDCARAGQRSPQLILADEPTGALDSHTSEDIMRLCWRSSMRRA